MSLLQAGPLHFLPGAVHAEDGDRELKAAIAYSLLSGTGWVEGGGSGGPDGSATEGP